MWTSRASLLVGVSLLGIALALTLPRTAAAAAAEHHDVLHQVVAGDDLRLIAGYYYGDTRQWERIWQANRDQVRNPNRIEREAFLRVPDTTVPVESYADFLARVRRPRIPEAAVPAAQAPPAPPVEVRISGEQPTTPSSQAPSPAPKQEKAATPASGATAPAVAPAKPTVLTSPPPPPAPRP